MPIALVNRTPTPQELQRLRLILSTFQDGTGQLAIQGNRTLPGWRDFERAVAFVFGGEAQESKAIFDVIIPDPDRKNIHYGVSCKMRRTLDDTARTGRVTLELSNSSGKFWDQLRIHGFDHENYKNQPDVVGKLLISLVESWYDQAKSDYNIDLSKSTHLLLSWNKSGWYQVFQFPLQLPDPQLLQWSFPTRVYKGRQVPGRRLIGIDETGTLFEWYGESGGQLKYYPHTQKALWISERFQLEPLPQDIEYGITTKAAAYFPTLWTATDKKY